MRATPLTRTEIIQTAFSEWGKTNFTTTSLSSLSKRLGVTKTALYKHFKNKDAILEEMRQAVLQEFAEIVDTFVAGVPPDTLREGVHTFFSSFFNFFLNKPEYFLFFILFIAKQPEAAGAEYQESRDKLTEFFIDLLQIDRKEYQRGQYIPVEIEFIFTNAIYWISLLLCNSDGASEHNIQEAVGQALAFTLTGIDRNNRYSVRDLETYLDACTVAKDDMQPPDKIFSAIAAIVAEEGVWNASVDKIATRLGMSKSSLYFYFENRDEMISTMLERERKQLMTLYAERENRYSTFQDKLFCYVLIFASYLLNKPDLLITFNWIRIQGIKVHMEKPDLDKLEEEFSFLFKNFKDHDVETFGLHIVELISLLNMQIIREVMNGFHYDIERHRIYTRILTLFNCFFHGIGGTNT